MSARAMTRAINAYYKDHPPDPELMAEISEGVQAIVMTRMSAESARHLRTHAREAKVPGPARRQAVAVHD